MLVRTLKKRDELKSDKAMEMLSMRSLAAKVKAAIATDSSFILPVFDVLAEGGNIVIRGVSHTPAEHKTIEEAARIIAGGVPVICDIHYRL